MTYPRLRFRISAKQDINTLQSFSQDARHDGGRGLSWAIFEKYPHLKTQFDNQGQIKNKELIRHFILVTYRSKRASMKLAIAGHKKTWGKIAPHYFLLIDNLFNDHAWPLGEYIAFGTIWGMYPRFLDNKTFSIPFWHRTPKYIPVIIAHELLHFMFYDCFYEYYPKYRRSEDNFFVWHVSEIFNTIVQNSPAWLSCFKSKSLGYPEHEKIVRRISRPLYRRHHWNTNALVGEIMKEVQNQKLAF